MDYTTGKLCRYSIMQTSLITCLIRQEVFEFIIFNERYEMQESASLIAAVFTAFCLHK